MQTVTIAVNEKVNVQAVPKDDQNNQGTAAGPITWTGSNPAVINVVQNPNPAQALEATVYAVGVGTATVAVAGVNSKGQAISTSFQVNVQALAATHFDFVFGAPLPQ